jgi:hypothetical protein
MGKGGWALKWETKDEAEEGNAEGGTSRRLFTEEDRALDSRVVSRLVMVCRASLISE